MEEVAIPGKYQMYFKPDKRAVRKAENLALVDRSRSSKRVAVAKSEGTTGDTDAATSSGAQGFENVAWRALELTYAQGVLPHPYFHRDYLEIAEVGRFN
ncbi:hypothetical protein BGZ58_000864 [Dissophora ornata]|nr:hypothetical protein BGZ58_000864 [Dissophora ornata]